jgi:16S rRNA processing protein RimM
MNKENCLFIGYLTKTYGINGEFLLKLNNNFCSDDLIEPESVFVEIDKKPVPFFLSSFNIKNRNEIIIGFTGIRTNSLSELLKGKKISIPEKLVTQNEPENNFYGIIGYKVNDKNHGYIGIFENILEYPGNHVMEINFNKKEILIPLNPDFILEINQTTETIYISAPEGLIDIYLE